MRGGVRILGEILRLLGLGGLLTAGMLALAAYTDQYNWASVRLLLVLSASGAAVGQLVYVWGRRPKVRTELHAGEPSNKTLSPKERARPARTASRLPASGMVPLADFNMADRMMATMKKMINAKQAGDAAAVDRAARKLAKMADADPATWEGIERHLGSGGA